MELKPIKKGLAIISITGTYLTLDGKTRRFCFYIDSKRYYNETDRESNIAIKTLKEGMTNIPSFSNIKVNVTNILFQEQKDQFDFLRKNGENITMKAIVYPEKLPDSGFNKKIEIPCVEIKGIIWASKKEADELGNGFIPCNCDYNDLREISREFSYLQ